MKKSLEFFVNFLVRAVVGITIIFLVNEFLMTQGINAPVGVNLLNVTVTGVFGVPGVIMLYGIGFY